MIFNLVKAAKQLFIDKTKTGVEADNVEDAITVLNDDLKLKDKSSLIEACNDVILDGQEVIFLQGNVLFFRIYFSVDNLTANARKSVATLDLAEMGVTIKYLTPCSFFSGMAYGSVHGNAAVSPTGVITINVDTVTSSTITAMVSGCLLVEKIN